MIRKRIKKTNGQADGLVAGKKVSGRKLQGRSRLTNGSQLLPFVDGRSLWARRFRDVLLDLLSDFGGEVQASEAQKSLCRRAACLTTELELMESKFAARGDGVGTKMLFRYCHAAGSLKRILDGLGNYSRTPQDITPPAPDQTSVIIEQLRELERHHVGQA